MEIRLFEKFFVHNLFTRCKAGYSLKCILDFGLHKTMSLMNVIWISCLPHIQLTMNTRLHAVLVGSRRQHRCWHVCQGLACSHGPQTQLLQYVPFCCCLMDQLLVLLTILQQCYCCRRNHIHTHHLSAKEENEKRDIRDDQINIQKSNDKNCQNDERYKHTHKRNTKNGYNGIFSVFGLKLIKAIIVRLD